MTWSDATTQATVIMCSAFLMGAMMVGCASTPDPQSDPSKQDIRQDSDRFFKKMGQEEGQQAPSP
ncbi:MAG: hypothetical protein CO149_03505 [Nitrospirae bacterium CG_4_9_14_3_um_filter_51_5]|nr:MAG: hypothetical protein CO149_03505 [Nitrospirae bacterium CG_4_9_14_3_um_filter_51_5]